MRMPSALGPKIEAVIDRDRRFRLHRKAVKYLCCYRSATGQVFAFERVTEKHITFWMPDDDAVMTAAAAEGLEVARSVPWPNPEQPHLYGRLSSLESIPELRDRTLYRIAVTTVGQALAIAGALR
jgi:hypothetical protein